MSTSSMCFPVTSHSPPEAFIVAKWVHRATPQSQTTLPVGSLCASPLAPPDSALDCSMRSGGWLPPRGTTFVSGACIPVKTECIT